jgi:hypothetical protein
MSIYSVGHLPIAPIPCLAYIALVRRAGMKQFRVGELIAIPHTSGYFHRGSAMYSMWPGGLISGALRLEVLAVSIVYSTCSD